MRAQIGCHRLHRFGDSHCCALTCHEWRVRDFRGLDPRSFDGRGNYALGVKEHIIFPEIDYDKAEAQLGLDIVVCTTAKTDAEARALLRAFNFPFRQ